MEGASGVVGARPEAGGLMNSEGSESMSLSDSDSDGGEAVPETPGLGLRAVRAAPSLEDLQAAGSNLYPATSPPSSAVSTPAGPATSTPKEHGSGDVELERSAALPSVLEAPPPPPAPRLSESEIKDLQKSMKDWENNVARELQDGLLSVGTGLFAAPPAFPPPMDASVKLVARNVQLAKRPTDEGFDESVGAMIAIMFHSRLLHKTLGAYQVALSSVVDSLTELAVGWSEMYAVDLAGMPQFRWGAEIAQVLAAALREGQVFNNCMSFFWKRVSREIQDFVNVVDYAAPVLEELGTLATVFDHKRVQCISLLNKGHVPAAQRRLAIEKLSRAMSKYQELQFILYHQILMYVLQRASPLQEPVLESTLLQDALFSNLRDIFAYTKEVLDLGPGAPKEPELVLSDEGGSAPSASDKASIDASDKASVSDAHSVVSDSGVPGGAAALDVTTPELTAARSRKKFGAHMRSPSVPNFAVLGADVEVDDGADVFGDLREQRRKAFAGPRQQPPLWERPSMSTVSSLGLDGADFVGGPPGHRSFRGGLIAVPPEPPGRGHARSRSGGYVPSHAETSSTDGSESEERERAGRRMVQVVRAPSASAILDGATGSAVSQRLGVVHEEEGGGAGGERDVKRIGAGASAAEDNEKRVEKFKQMMAARYGGDATDLRAGRRWRREPPKIRFTREEPRDLLPTFTTVQRFLQVTEKPYTLMSVLMNPVGVAHLRRFARSLDFESPILFFEKVRRYLCTDPVRFEERMDAAVQIYNVFLLESFDSPLRLPFVRPHQLKKIETILSEAQLGNSPPPDSIFDGILEEAFRVIQTEIFPSFCKSDAVVRMFAALETGGFVSERLSKETVSLSVLEYRELRERVLVPRKSKAEDARKKRQWDLEEFRRRHGVAPTAPREVGGRYAYASRDHLLESAAYSEVSTLIQSQADLFVEDPSVQTAEFSELVQEPSKPVFFFNDEEFALERMGSLVVTALSRQGVEVPSLRRHPHARAALWRASPDLLMPDVSLTQFVFELSSSGVGESVEKHEKQRVPAFCPRCCRRIALVECGTTEWYSCVCSFLVGEFQIYTDHSKGVYGVAAANLLRKRGDQLERERRHLVIARPWKRKLDGRVFIGFPGLTERIPMLSCHHSKPAARMGTQDCDSCVKCYPSFFRPSLFVESKDVELLLRALGRLENSERYPACIAVLDREMLGVGEMREYLPDPLNDGGTLVRVLRSRGFTHVFERTVGNKIRVLETSQDFVVRSTLEGRNRGTSGLLPMMFSNCPALDGLVEKHFPQFVTHLSSVKSTLQIVGSLAKTYVAGMLNLDSADVFVCAVGSAAEKREAQGVRFTTHGVPSVDCVLLPLELASFLLWREPLDVTRLEAHSDAFDIPFPCPRHRVHLAPRPAASASATFMREFERRGSIVRAVASIAHRILTPNRELWAEWEEDEEDSFEPHPTLKNVLQVNVDGEERSLKVGLVHCTERRELGSVFAELSLADTRFDLIEVLCEEDFLANLVDDARPPPRPSLSWAAHAQSASLSAASSPKRNVEDALSHLRDLRKRFALDLEVAASLDGRTKKRSAVSAIYESFLNVKVTDGGLVKEYVLSTQHAPLSSLIDYVEPDFDVVVDASTGQVETRKGGVFDFGKPPSDSESE